MPQRLFTKMPLMHSALGTLKTHRIITFERIDTMNIETSKVGSVF